VEAREEFKRRLCEVADNILDWLGTLNVEELQIIVESLDMVKETVDAVIRFYENRSIYAKIHYTLGYLDGFLDALRLLLKE
jgi:hypothetical protein